MDALEKGRVDAEPVVQWAMNFCAGQIGILEPEYRSRCIALGEGVGLYKDEIVRKNCVPSYLPYSSPSKSRSGSVERSATPRLDTTAEMHVAAMRASREGSAHQSAAASPARHCRLSTIEASAAPGIKVA